MGLTGISDGTSRFFTLSPLRTGGTSPGLFGLISGVPPTLSLFISLTLGKVRHETQPTETCVTRDKTLTGDER